MPEPAQGQPGPPQGLRGIVARGVVWTTLGFTITKGLAFLSLVVLARLLAPGQFGLVAGITIVLSIIELTADLGMGQTVIYEQEQGVGPRVHVAFTVNMALTTVLTLVAIALAPLVAAFFHAGHHTGLFRLAMADIFLTGLGSVHDGLLLRDMGFRPRILTQVISAVVRAGLSIGLAFSGLGAAALVWGMLGGTAAWTAALWWITGFLPRLRFDRAVARAMVSYGVGASLLQLLSQLDNQIDPSVVGKVLGVRALGLYTVAFRIPTLLLENIANQVSLVALPALSRKRVADALGVGGATRQLVRYQAMYALPVAATLAVLARPVVETVFSAKWRDCAGVFAAVSILSGISASAFALGDAFKALGRQRVMIALSLVQIPLMLVTVIVVAPYGITAVAWARTGGMVVWVGMMILAAQRVLAIPALDTVIEMWPGAVAAGGVVVAAGGLRLLTGLSGVPAIFAGAAAGVCGAVVALALLARPMFAELRGGVVRLRARTA